MGKFTFDEINSMYFDVLKEIGNIGAGNATTAIATLLNVKLNMEVPNVKLMPVQDLNTAIGSEEEEIVGIYLGVQNDIDGSLMFLLKMDAAHHLVNLLLGRSVDYKEPFDEMDLSAMKEIGNIIAGSYLSALSAMTSLTISPTVPYISVDMAGAILSIPAIQFGQFGDNALLIETSFGGETMLQGYFILLPELDSYDKILASLGIVL
ncbi:MAG: chemotaxis protein CheC [Eubacterium sp.]|jgi:chemotaxis protein CheC|nr:chemotaxis protein CheC [Eubacterium sp.]